MAVINTSQMGDIFNDKIRPGLVQAFNRAAPEVSLFGRGEYALGSTIEWNVDTAGDNQAGGVAEGADVSSYSDNDTVTAKQTFLEYQDAFKISGKALRRAMAAGSPEGVYDQMGKSINDCAVRLADSLAGDFWSGGGGNDLVGVLTQTNGGLGLLGTYANIDRSSVTEWAGNRLNGGATEFSFDSWRAISTTVAIRRRFKPNIWFCSHDVFNYLDTQLDAKVDYNVDALRIDGYALKFAVGVDVIRGPGGGLVFPTRHLALADGLIGLKLQGVGIYSQPNPALGPDEFEFQLSTQNETVFGTGETLPFRCVIKRLGNDGNYSRFIMTLYPQSVVWDPAEHIIYNNFTLS